jgi:hypothetical protein
VELNNGVPELTDDILVSERLLRVGVDGKPVVPQVDSHPTVQGRADRIRQRRSQETKREGGVGSRAGGGGVRPLTRGSRNDFERGWFEEGAHWLRLSLTFGFCARTNADGRREGLQFVELG